MLARLFRLCRLVQPGPLDHPEIAPMGQRDLADLPLPRC